MALKIRFLVIVLILSMILFEVANGIDLNTLNPLSSKFNGYNDYAPYYPDKDHMNYQSPNLFVGGILQNSRNGYIDDSKFLKFADHNGAIFIPTYYSSITTELLAVNDAAKAGTKDENGEYRSGASDENGLTRSELHGKTYGTVIGYSGGTTTVVTAMADQGVKADTLILISPMMGGSLIPGEKFDWKGEFEKKLQTILSRGTKIVVIQSPDDKLPLGDKSDLAAGFQYRFPEPNTIESSNWMNSIEINTIKGLNQISIFDDFAMQHINKGVYDGSQDQNAAQENAAVDALSVGFQQGTSYELDSGIPLRLKDGYELNLKSTDQSGTKIYIELSKDGRLIDSAIVIPGIATSISQDNVDGMYEYTKNNMPLIRVHFINTFCGVDIDRATLDSIWQVSEGNPSVTLKDESNEIILALGTPLILADGYELLLKSIDPDCTRIYIELSKDGQIIDDKVIAPPNIDDGIYEYPKAKGQASTATPVIRIHFTHSFRGADKYIAAIDGIWQASSTS